MPNEKALKTEVLGARCNPKLYELVEQVAKLKGLSVSQYLLTTIKEKLALGDRELSNRAVEIMKSKDNEYDWTKGREDNG